MVGHEQHISTYRNTHVRAGQNQMQKDHNVNMLAATLHQGLPPHSTRQELCGQLLTDLIDDNAAEGDAPLPAEGRLKQQAAAGAQRAADDVRFQDDDALGLLWASLNLRQ